MLWKIKALFVLLSVAFNGAVVAAWVHQSRQGQSCPEQDAGPRPCMLLHKIGASEEQLRTLQPRFEEFRQASEALCRDISGRRQELIDLLASAPTDRRAIEAKEQEILAGQRKMEELVVAHLLAVKENLRPDQRKAMFDLIRSRCGCAATVEGLSGRNHAAQEDCADADPGN